MKPDDAHVRVKNVGPAYWALREAMNFTENKQLLEMIWTV
jgi:hypothetical protein